MFYAPVKYFKEIRVKEYVYAPAIYFNEFNVYFCYLLNPTVLFARSVTRINRLTTSVGKYIYESAFLHLRTYEYVNA